ncbi:hypothetical protein Taro_025518 [Colocasia esculenta]|uniref:Uncharacterized protein n=1 Tax=Colocasia esculenta TaxID=4460 RepID=A0A843VKQ9_COLES|nr:hypothetical protein [Colocasia esculenta]
MASRGRRGGVPARDDEQRREERAEQQAPAPQGPVLPPPPPVDYRVFMQGLVHAMQTQAHTQAALQAQLEAQAILASTPGRLGGVSVQTWTPTLILASRDMDANLSGLHAQQSCKLLKQESQPLGTVPNGSEGLSSHLCFLLSLWTHSLLRRTGVVGDVAPLEEAAETDSERGD